MAWNIVSIGKNLGGLGQAAIEQDPVKALSSGVKLAKSTLAPGADFIPGLEDAFDGVVDEAVDALFEPVVDVVSGTGLDEIVEDIGANAHAFYGTQGMDGIQDMMDDDDDGWPDTKGVVKTATSAVSFSDNFLETAAEATVEVVENVAEAASDAVESTMDALGSLFDW